LPLCLSCSFIPFFCVLVSLHLCLRKDFLLTSICLLARGFFQSPRQWPSLPNFQHTPACSTALGSGLVAVSTAISPCPFGASRYLCTSYGHTLHLQYHVESTLGLKLILKMQHQYCQILEQVVLDIKDITRDSRWCLLYVKFG
jgi:hypothetical protein